MYWNARGGDGVSVVWLDDTVSLLILKREALYHSTNPPFCFTEFSNILEGEVELMKETNRAEAEIGYNAKPCPECFGVGADSEEVNVKPDVCGGA